MARRCCALPHPSLPCLQALRSLEEHPYSFTLCPEEAAPTFGHREHYQDVECSLSLPVFGPGSPREGMQANAGVSLTSSSGNSGQTSPNAPTPGFAARSGVSPTTDEEKQDKAIGWRILPARLAISLRLERLEASRPARPERVLPIAPPNSVCRLRLHLQGISVLSSHPDLISAQRLLESSSVALSLEGSDASDGVFKGFSSRSWRVPCRRTKVMCRKQGDFLLPIPKLRKGLSLKVSLASQAAALDATKDPLDAGITVGEVRIDWQGLACLPVDRTDYFAMPSEAKPLSRDTPGSTAGYPSVTLELNAPSSSSWRCPPTRPSSSQVAPLSTTGVFSSSLRGDPSGPVFEEGALVTKSTQKQACGRRTAGVVIRLRLHLEESRIFVPYVLEFSPVEARGGTHANHHGQAREQRTFTSLVSLGDFRNPSRLERFPYLRFGWPRKRNEASSGWVWVSSRVPCYPWVANGTRKAVTWSDRPRHDVNRIVSVPLLAGHTGAHEASPRKTREIPRAGGMHGVMNLVGPSASCANALRRPRKSTSRSDLVLVAAYDMGWYAPAEHRASETIGRFWRKTLRERRDRRRVREAEAERFRHDAATRFQALYRGWRGRRRAGLARALLEERRKASRVIQRAWRCVRSRACSSSLQRLS